MKANVLLKLFNELVKSDTIQGLLRMPSRFLNKYNRMNET